MQSYMFIFDLYYFIQRSKQRHAVPKPPLAGVAVTSVTVQPLYLLDYTQSIALIVMLIAMSKCENRAVLEIYTISLTGGYKCLLHDLSRHRVQRGLLPAQFEPYTPSYAAFFNVSL